jgi:hypothetical protein
MGYAVMLTRDFLMVETYEPSVRLSIRKWCLEFPEFHPKYIGS